MKFFDVYYRRINLSNDNIVYNIIFYDVTDLILANIKIDEENKIKHRVLAKMAHEFKTPLTSITSLISLLLSSYEDISINKNIDVNNFCDSKKKDEKVKNENHRIIDTLNLIQNLSNYVIILTSDIIHFSNPNNIDDIQLNNQKIDLRDISTFCFDILKSLLYCNNYKFKKIIPELFFDDLLDFIELYTDEVKLKQILLNFISNSVKFTNEGFIKLNFSKCLEKNQLKISVEDSGIGIREESKVYLFRDYSKLEKNNTINSLNKNNIGSGLGLSICKNLADKLKMKINIQSDYRKGSIISLIINYDNLEKNLKKYKKDIYQLNCCNSDLNSILEEKETKIDKMLHLNYKLNKTKNIILDDYYKQRSKDNNKIIIEDYFKNDSLNENDLIIKQNKSKNRTNYEENERLFNNFSIKKSTRNNNNFCCRDDSILIKSKENKFFGNNINQITDNLVDFSIKKFSTGKDIIDFSKLDYIKKNYNFPYLNEIEKPFSYITSNSEKNLIKYNINYNEKNNSNKSGKFQKIYENAKIENKLTPSSSTLNYEENNPVSIFLIYRKN